MSLASGHAVNRTGVSAGCHDCHIPHDYPQLLWYKAKAGVKDVIGEMRGVIDTEAKFKKERARTVRGLAERANDPFIKGRLLDLISRYEDGAQKLPQG